MDAKSTIEGQKYFVKYWLSKIKVLDCFNFQGRLSLYKQALEFIPGSYKIWKTMFDEFNLYLRNKCILNNKFAEFESLLTKSLEYMKKMPRVWLIYMKYLESSGRIIDLYNLINRCLETLPVTQHDKIWKFVVPWAEALPIQELAMSILKRYLKYDESYKENMVVYFEKMGNFNECTKYLSEIVTNTNFYSEKGISHYEYSMKLCLILASKKTRFEPDKAEEIFNSCLSKYSDEIGNIWVYFAEFYIRRGQFRKAREVFNLALEKVMTNKDFGIVYDAFLKLEEEILTFVFDDQFLIMDEKSLKRVTSELSTDGKNVQQEQIEKVETLMKKREILLNSTKLRQNKNSVQTWLERFSLLTENEEDLQKAFLESISNVDSLKADGFFSKIWIYIARFYEYKRNFYMMNQVYLQSLEKNFRNKSDYQVIFKNWIETLLKYGFQKDCMCILKSFLFEYGGTSAYFSRILKAKSIINTSNEIWSLYLDLEYNFGLKDDLNKGYQMMLSKKIISPLNTFNYLKLLQKEENWEKIVKVCESALSLFKWPALHFIWLFYIDTYQTQYGASKKERIRDLYCRVLESCPKEKGFLISYDLCVNVCGL